MTSKINFSEYQDKVRGCWLGKNIGGTLGAPFENKPQLNDVSFYTQELNGNPLPNDDLDIQLLFLAITERYGVYNITPRLLGEYWINAVSGPWNEYSVARQNICAGFYPPLSGNMNNDYWKNSNGAWIRSEIWACLFPGCPDEAICFAWMDATIDHAGEGVYAEMFTVALQAAAFVESNLLRLIEIGLSKIPVDCLVYQCVDIVRQYYLEGKDWTEARSAVVKKNNLGWFQAPANVAFMIIGILYGKGDFGQTICLAVNCGDDTDCTAATAGALMGILHGANAIPENWLKPIGDGIVTIALNRFGFAPSPIPATVTELAARVVFLAEGVARENPQLLQFVQGSGTSGDDLLNQSKAKELWARSSNELTFELLPGEIAVDYLDTPIINSGKPFKLKLSVRKVISYKCEIIMRWHLPDGWQCETPELRFLAQFHAECPHEIEIIPGEINKSILYIPLEVIFSDSSMPHMFMIPFQKAAATHFPAIYSKEHDCKEYMNMHQRITSRIGYIKNQIKLIGGCDNEKTS